jgi:hypothetical protein
LELFALRGCTGCDSFFVEEGPCKRGVVSFRHALWFQSKAQLGLVTRHQEAGRALFLVLYPMYIRIDHKEKTAKSTYVEIKTFPALFIRVLANQYLQIVYLRPESKIVATNLVPEVV